MARYARLSIDDDFEIINEDGARISRSRLEASGPPFILRYGDDGTPNQGQIDHAARQARAQEANAYLLGDAVRIGEEILRPIQFYFAR